MCRLRDSWCVVMGHSSLLTADKHEMAICSIYLPSHYLGAQPVWSWVPGPGPAKALPLNIISISLVTRGGHTAHTGPCHKSIQLWTRGAWSWWLGHVIISDCSVSCFTVSLECLLNVGTFFVSDETATPSFQRCKSCWNI